jgi:hypothetical protein
LAHPRTCCTIFSKHATAKGGTKNVGEARDQTRVLVILTLFPQDVLKGKEGKGRRDNEDGETAESRVKHQ